MLRINGPRQGTGEAAPAVSQLQDAGGWDGSTSSGVEGVAASKHA